jgi:MHS family proline/betaine transporter-like MFS transporter
MVEVDGEERYTAAPRRATILAVVIGNALEWYEIVIYGYLATIIAQLFFPADDAGTSLLLAFASFGLTYLSRPLGAVVLGIYADRFGRKAALQLSIWMMVVASAAIVLVPTYASIGIVASVIVVVSRLLQGFSAGGEFGSATAFLAEQDAARRGYLASWQFASQGLTALLATGTAAALTILLTVEQMKAWGWRLPFMVGLLFYPLGIYVRAQLAETAEFRRAQITSEHVRFGVHWRSLTIAIGLIVLGTVAVYTMVFLPTYAVRELHLSAADGFIAGVVTALLQLALIPPFGALSDRIGRTPAPLVAAVAMLLGAWPALAWLNQDPSFMKLLALQILLGAGSAAYLGAMPALLAELFPVHVRSTGLSVSYAVGVAVFGGLAPLVQTWLIMRTGNPTAPAIYIIAAAAVSLVALYAARRIVPLRP